MEFKPIFVNSKPLEECKIWTVCFPEDSDNRRDIDIFGLFFKRLTSTDYLFKFFLENEADLNRDFWNYMQIDEAIDKVYDEAIDFSRELKNIEADPSLYDENILDTIFEVLHKEHIINKNPSLSIIKKARPDNRHFPQMVRIYAIKLEDCYIITGGVIKLTLSMDKPHIDFEVERLNRVLAYLKKNFIINVQGLI